MTHRHPGGFARLYDPVHGPGAQPSWHEPTISYRELVKGGRLLSAYPPGCWRALGISRQDMYRVQPLLLYFAALVYKGDLAYEEAQRRGSCEVSAALFKEELERLFRGHGLYDDTIKEGLDDMERYGVLESRIVLRQVPLTPDLLRTACRLRSSDAVMLIRVLAKLAETDCEGLLTLLRPWLVLWELDDDLVSYTSDVAEGTFNILDLHVRLHGPESASQRLQEFQTSLLAEMFDAMDQAGRDDLLRMSILTSRRAAPVTHLLRALPRRVLLPAAKRLQLWEGRLCPEIPEIRVAEGRGRSAKG